MADALAANARVYLTQRTVYALSGWTLAQVQQAKLSPDSDAFPEDGWTVYCSATNPSGATAANTVYVWVAQTAADPTETPAPTEAPAPSEQPQPTEKRPPTVEVSVPVEAGADSAPAGECPTAALARTRAQDRQPPRRT